MFRRFRLLRRLRNIVGADAVLERAEDRMLYEYDASIDRAQPDYVVFPQTTEHVSALMRVAAEFNLPVIARGAGTGLSGGAIPVVGGIMLALSRMNKILEIDLANERAIVQPGVVNLELSNTVNPRGYMFAPDPSSQKACTIGGNVAENSGGPHTLALGVTTNHVSGVEVVLPSGEVVEFGSRGADSLGYDLTGTFIGSEGTFGIATKICCKLTRLPEATATLLAIYDNVESAANTVVAITSAGITPGALEMLDGWTLRAVEASVRAGYPLDSAAVLLIELEGLREAVEEQAESVEQICKSSNAREVRRARDARESQLLWAGRKGAFGALGRISPSFYVQDGVIPRTRIPSTLKRIEEIGKKYNLQIGNIFHAGDGNLHPLIMFDSRDPEQRRKTIAAGNEILEYCISVGGSITGEHGVGMEKMNVMPSLFSADDLEFMRRLRHVFNPDGRLNPGKVLPSPRVCKEAFAPGHPSVAIPGEAQA